MSKKSSSKKIELEYQPTLTQRGVEKLQKLIEKLAEKNPAIKKIQSIKSFMKSGNLSDLSTDEKTVFKVLDEASATDLKGLFVGRKFSRTIDAKDIKIKDMGADKARKAIYDELKLSLKNSGQQQTVAGKTGGKKEKDTETISLVVKKSNAQTNKTKIPEQAEELLALIQGKIVDEFTAGGFFTGASDDVLTQLLAQSDTVEDLAQALGDSIEGEDMQARINWLNENFKEQFVRAFHYLIGGAWDKMVKVKGKDERKRMAKDSKTVYKHVVKSVSPIKSIDFGLTVPKAPSLLYLKRINNYYQGRTMLSTTEGLAKIAEMEDAERKAGSALDFLTGKNIEKYADQAQEIKENPEVALYFNALRASVKPTQKAELDFIESRAERIKEGRQTKENIKEGKTGRLSSTKTTVGSFLTGKEICDSAAFKTYVEKLSLQNVPKADVCKMFKITMISEKIHDLEVIHEADWDNMSDEAKTTYAGKVADRLTAEVLGESGYQSLSEATNAQEIKKAVQTYLPRLYLLRQIFIKGTDEDNKRTREVVEGSIKDISDNVKEAWFTELKGRMGVSGEYSDSLIRKPLSIEVKKKRSSSKKTVTGPKKVVKRPSSEKKKPTPKGEEDEENPFGEFSAQAKRKSSPKNNGWGNTKKNAKASWDEEEDDEVMELKQRLSDLDEEAYAKRKSSPKAKGHGNNGWGNDDETKSKIGRLSPKKTIIIKKKK